MEREKRRDDCGVLRLGHTLIVEIVAVQTLDAGVGGAFVERNLLCNLRQGSSQLIFVYVLSVHPIKDKSLGAAVVSQNTERIQDALLHSRGNLFLLLDVVISCLVQAVFQTWRIVGVKHHTAIFVRIQQVLDRSNSLVIISTEEQGTLRVNGFTTRTLWCGSDQLLSLVEVLCYKGIPDLFWVLFFKKVVFIKIRPTLLCWDVDGHSILQTITLFGLSSWFIAWRNKEVKGVKLRALTLLHTSSTTQYTNTTRPLYHQDSPVAAKSTTQFIMNTVGCMELP